MHALELKSISSSQGLSKLLASFSLANILFSSWGMLKRPKHHARTATDNYSHDNFPLLADMMLYISESFLPFLHIFYYQAYQNEHDAKLNKLMQGSSTNAIYKALPVSLYA